MDIAKNKHKNLQMAWIDYFKTYDSVPQGRDSRIFKVVQSGPSDTWYFDKCDETLEDTMVMTFPFFEVFSREMDRIITLLFVIALMPLSTILNSTSKGFHAKDGLTLSHLLNLDDFKFFC